ncbi:MAG: hypothetical protein ACJAVL_000271, partial [Bacteroidia bacterium]
MKKLLTILIIMLGVSAFVGQEAAAQNVLDGVYVKEHYPT